MEDDAPPPEPTPGSDYGTDPGENRTEVEPYSPGYKRMLPGPPHRPSDRSDRTDLSSVTHVALTKAVEILTRPGVKDEISRQLWDNSVVGLALTDEDGVFLRVNPKFCEMIGYNDVELIGRKTSQELTISTDLPADREKAAQTLAGEIPGYRMRKSYRHKREYVVPVNLTVTRVSDDGGRFALFLKQVAEERDLTGPPRRVGDPPEADNRHMRADEEVIRAVVTLFKHAPAIRNWILGTGVVGFLIAGYQVYQTDRAASVVDEVKATATEAKDAAKNNEFQSEKRWEVLDRQGKDIDRLIREMERIKADGLAKKPKNANNPVPNPNQ